MDTEYNSKIIELLSGFLGEYKSSSETQFQFNCPECAEEEGEVDNKFNFEVSLEKGLYHCWKCGESNDTKGSISKLFKRYGSKQDYKRFLDIVNEYKLNELYFPVSDKNEKQRLIPKIELPDTFTQMILSLAPKEAANYLIERGITQKMCYKFNIGYTQWDEPNFLMRQRIIFPSYDCYGRLNYWLGRDWTGKKLKTKYMNAKIDKKDIVFGENRINWDGIVYLVEGVFDAMAIPNAVPLLGKALSEKYALYDSLISKANKVVICLDGDAPGDILKIYNFLNSTQLHNRVKCIFLPKEEDPSSIWQKYGKYGIINILQQAKQLSEVDEIKERISNFE